MNGAGPGKGDKRWHLVVPRMQGCLVGPIWESEVRHGKRSGHLVEKVGVGPGCRIWAETGRKVEAQYGQRH